MTRSRMRRLVRREVAVQLAARAAFDRAARERFTLQMLAVLARAPPDTS